MESADSTSGGSAGPDKTGSCILCDSTSIVPQGTLYADDVDRTWQQKYGIAVRGYFPSASVTNFVCRRCSLDFYQPASPGDDEFYAKLQRFDWYYEHEKWEFGQARALLQKPGAVLEIGCGPGNFLQRLVDDGRSDVCGVDSNKGALAAAKARGINMFANLSEVGERKFAYVFAFQILEHIAQPREFLQTLASLLSPGGALVIAVPNQDSFIGDSAANELNQPPHHCLRFRPVTLANLGEYLPLRLQKLYFEPLAAHHVSWFISSKLSKLEPRRVTTRLAWKVGAPIAERTLRLERLRRRIRGHSMLAVYERT